MSERSMRGTRLGAQSMESEDGVQPAARQDVSYLCPHGHAFVVPMLGGGRDPRRCGSAAAGRWRCARTPRPRSRRRPSRPRTHWDMLMERRTTAELEELLDERLELLRSGRLTQRRSA